MNSQPTEPPRRSFLGARKRAARDVQAAEGWATGFVSPGHDHADGWDHPESADPAAPHAGAATPTGSQDPSGFPPATGHTGPSAYADPYAPGVYPDPLGYPGYQGGHPGQGYQEPPSYPAFADHGGLPLSDYSSMPDYPSTPVPGDAQAYPPATYPPAPQQPAAERGPFVPARPAAGPPPTTGPIPVLDAWGQTPVAHDEYTHEEYAYPADAYGAAAYPGGAHPPRDGYEADPYGLGPLDPAADPAMYDPAAHTDAEAGAGPAPGAGLRSGNAEDPEYVLSDVTPMPVPAPGEGEQTRWAVLAYLTVPFFGPVLPLVAYLQSLRRSRWLRGHAVKALNVWLTVLLYQVSAVIVGGMLFLDSAQAAFEVMGPIVAALWLVSLFYLIRAARSASQGGDSSFPRWLCMAR